MARNVGHEGGRRDQGAGNGSQQPGITALGVVIVIGRIIGVLVELDSVLREDVVAGDHVSRLGQWLVPHLVVLELFAPLRSE